MISPDEYNAFRDELNAKYGKERVDAVAKLTNEERAELASRATPHVYNSSNETKFALLKYASVGIGFIGLFTDIAIIILAAIGFLIFRSLERNAIPKEEVNPKFAVLWLEKTEAKLKAWDTEQKRLLDAETEAKEGFAASKRQKNVKVVHSIVDLVLTSTRTLNLAGGDNATMLSMIDAELRKISTDDALLEIAANDADVIEDLQGIRDIIESMPQPDVFITRRINKILQAK